VLVASLLALGMSVWSSYQTRSYAACQAQVNESLVRVQSARAEAAEQDRQSDRDESAATAELIRTVFTVQTPTERVAAYTAYRTALDKIAASRADTERQRAAAPLPAPPSEICG
jgi:hypothetical protein